MGKNILTLTDHRTGETYELPITNGTINAMDLRKIKTHADDFGLMSYDPGFKNTAACKSKITFIDGEKGILRYRGIQLIKLPKNAVTLKPPLYWLTANFLRNLN